MKAFGPGLAVGRNPRWSSGLFGFFLGFTSSSGVCKRSSRVFFPSGFCTSSHLWRKLRTTNVIERCFVEVRRRTRPMVCFVNVESVDRIIYSIFQRFSLLNLFTRSLTSPLPELLLLKLNDNVP